MSIVILTRQDEIHVSEFKLSFGSFLTHCGRLISPKFRNIMAFKGNARAVKCVICNRFLLKQNYSSMKNTSCPSFQKIDFVNKTGSQYWKYRNLSLRHSNESNKYYDKDTNKYF